jgi:DNA-binding PadR family transcriptional regulator
MPAISALGYALLCALHKGPLTGYDLVRRMDRPIGYYWSARQSQIYPELGRLTEDGLVASDAEAGPGPHQKRTHRLTAAGRMALGTWLPQPAAPARDRDELVLKTYALRAADPAEMRVLYLTEAARHEAQLASYREQQAVLMQAGADSPDHLDFGAYATLELGVRREEYHAEWCRWLAAQLLAAITA